MSIKERENCKDITNDKKDQFVLKPSFLEVLKKVGADGKVFTLSQVVSYLKEYVLMKKLYDPKDPRKVHCEDDELESVFGVKNFTISDVMKLLASNMFLCGGTRSGATSNSNAEVLKRKIPEIHGETSKSVEDTNKKAKINEENMNSRCPSPMLIFIPDTPTRESSDSELSLQGYETAFVKDSTDDLWYLEEDEYEVELEEDCSFQVEYEVESLSSLKGGDTDTDSDIQDIVHAAVLLYKDDSDKEFWADSSDNDGSSSDSEIAEGDKWHCTHCDSINKPPLRFCEKCWEERLGWLPDRSDRHPPKKLRHRKLNQSLPRRGSDHGYHSYQVPVSGLSSSQEPLSDKQDLSQPSTSQDKQSSSSQDELFQTKDSSILSSLQDSAGGQCSICFLRPKTGTMIHGRTAHQVCCYKCARRLQSSGQKCPVCRRTIQRVVRNFIL
ncbi:E3 ubiquitin-protein ligase Mdm2-like isoform X1 [Tachypleus tridentatus]|uniref:E3 ubiquitin-protein ligase Mdm2-like isoform X1 n=2 Tax=Tachypleus tridentatus TaxID=6853 RepID=UPI003FCFFBAB